MGFLDHSTKNIILDTVLTEYGREAIARADGSFNPVKVSFIDDEIDYTIIQKYGRTVGKEKIEATTPIVEASTSGVYGAKYFAITAGSRQDLYYLPNYRVASKSTVTGSVNTGVVNSFSDSTNIVNLGIGAGLQKTQQVILNQNTNDPAGVPIELIDTTFFVEMDSRFVYIQDQDPIPSPGVNETYLLYSNGTSNNASQLVFNVSLKPISNSEFSKFGGATKNVIKTFIRVTGTSSGQVVDIEVQIKNNNIT